MTAEGLLKENKARNDEINTPFNPLTGAGAVLERRPLHLADYALPVQHLPVAMFEVPLVSLLQAHGSIQAFIENHLKAEHTPENREKVIRQFIRVRNRYDFCFWAYAFARIKNKDGGDDVPFRLNRPQRRLIERLEAMRLAGKPIRLILLKARQWGGSTAVQVYMAWIQLCHKTGWNSIVVSHVKDSSVEVSGMFTKLMAGYPHWLLYEEGEEYNPKAPKLTAFEGSQNIDIVPQRNCKIKIGTAMMPESARGGDSAMAHCTEVAFWVKTDNKTPEQIVRSACSGMLYAPLTLEIFESTANGTGNFFHTEWQRAKDKESDKEPLFIAWFDIEKYAMPITYASLRELNIPTDETRSPEENFADHLLDNRNNANNNGQYNYWLWTKGATLEAINWYVHNRRRFKEHADMAAEYPSDDIEAFKHSGQKVFNQYKVEELRKNCREPKFIGDVYGDATEGKDALRNLRFMEDKQGVLNVWELPEKEPRVADRYLTIVDVGGRSTKADFSDILVIDRFWMMDGDHPCIVAEWHGHIDHDLLAWKAAQIAAFYDNSLLVIESNTLETKDRDRDTDGNHTAYILNQIADVYDNLYARRQSDEDILQGAPRKYGFHTNTATKPMIIDHLIKMVRELSWIERCTPALDEFLCYEKKQNGAFGAISGKHDDRLMTRAIGLFICYCEMPLPKIIEEVKTKSRRKIISEATI